MCRFVLYQGPPLTLASLVVDPANSIINQSLRAHESEDPLNGDGFGVGWYAPDLSPEPAVFRSFTPAWSNRNLINVAKVTRSPCILAHVRAATPGLPVSELDCHPFTNGPYAFMHNGDLAYFPAIRRKLMEHLSDRAFATIHGGTDSEHVFATVLDKLWGATVSDPAVALATSLTGALRDLLALSAGAANGEQEDSYLNIAISDGARSVITRFTTAEPDKASSLYLHTGRRYVCEGNVCRMVSPETGQGAIIVSSEPLSDDGGWQKVPPNHMVIVREDRTADVRAMDL
jgi:predicted glutamine amidotransferase